MLEHVFGSQATNVKVLQGRDLARAMELLCPVCRGTLLQGRLSETEAAGAEVYLVVIVYAKCDTCGIIYVLRRKLEEPEGAP